MKLADSYDCVESDKNVRKKR